MTKDAHGVAFFLERNRMLLFNSLEPRIGVEEGDADDGDFGWTAPFIRKIDLRAKHQSLCVQLGV